MAITVAILCQSVPKTYARHRVEYALLARIVPSIVDLWSASAARSCAKTSNLTPEPPKLCTVRATTVGILCQIVPQPYARHRVEYAHLSRIVPSIVDLWSASAAPSCAKTSNLTQGTTKALHSYGYHGRDTLSNRSTNLCTSPGGVCASFPHSAVNCRPLVSKRRSIVRKNSKFDAGTTKALHRDRKSTRLNSSHLGISYAV